MADIPSNPDKINDLEVSFEAPLSETLFNKFGANINFLLDFLGLTSSQTFTGGGNFNVPEDVTRVLILAWGGGGGGGGNASSGIRDGQGGAGGATIWSDPTNGTTNFYGGNGGSPVSSPTFAKTIAETSPSPSTSLLGNGGFSNGGSFGGYGADSGGAGPVVLAANGSSFLNYIGGAGGTGIGTGAGGGGGAGPGGVGAAGSNGGATTAGVAPAVNTGAGGGGASSNNLGGAGGGAGSPQYSIILPVTGLDTIPVFIGVGGAGGFPTLGAGAVAGGNGGGGWLQVWW